MPDGSTARPIFIVGPMGSGTTLMRLIIDSHDDIAVAQETSIMRAYLAHRWIPFHRYGGEWYGRLGWSDEELDARMGDFYRGMFERFAASQGKSRWGEKTPWHAWHLRELARVFPDAQFIAMVRQPGGVAASMKGRFRQTYAGCITHWINITTEQVQRGLELGDRLLVVRYEDLVTDPEVTLREVFAWLDAPWSDRLLAHNEVHAERGTATWVEGATRSDKPIETTRVGAWRDELSEEQLAILRRRVGDLAPFYGYDATDPTVLDPMTVEGSPRSRTLTGTDLAVRKAAFPHLAEDLERTLTPWAGNAMLKPSAFGLSDDDEAVPAALATKSSTATAPTRAKGQGQLTGPKVPSVRDSARLLRAALANTSRRYRRKAREQFSR